MSFRKILIAVQSEPVAAQAATIGIELAQALGAGLAFIYVVDPDLGYGGDSGIPPAELMAADKKDGEKLIAAIRQHAPQLAALEFMPTGDPATEIVQAAKAWPAELIVMGSHGRGGIQRAVLGSVAEAVMRHAPCPVMVIRSKA